MTPEQVSAKNRAYYVTHREERIADEAARRAVQGDAIRATARAKRAADVATAKAKERADYRRNRAAILERQNQKRANGAGNALAHGLTPEQYHALFAAQGGLCAICRTPMARICIDHDHATGAVRGLLCFSCNVVLGHMRDSPAALRAAADYVEQTRAKVVIGESLGRAGESIPLPVAEVAVA